MMDMRKGKAHEMRKFLISISVLVITLLIIGIIYNILDTRTRLKREENTERQRVVDQLSRYVMDSFAATMKVGEEPQSIQGLDIQFILEASKGNYVPVMQFIAKFFRNLYNLEYVAFIKDGVVIVENTREGLAFPGGDVPKSFPPQDSQLLTKLGDRDGYFISMCVNTPLPGQESEQFANLVLDRSEQIAEIGSYYQQQRKNSLHRQILIGIILIAMATILSTLGVFLLSRYFITGPIQEITRISRQIMEGTFQGEIKVNRESDFAQLQGLLQSGKLIMEKMGELEE